MTPEQKLPAIPFLDLRGQSPLALLEEHAEKAHALVAASRRAFGRTASMAAHAALPVADYASRRWLEKTNNPYRGEIAKAAALLNTRGIYTLNLCYEWGCTSAVYFHEGRTIFLRVLDWPFPGLGEGMVVVRQQGLAGEFLNITWPGMSGVYQAAAAGRFIASINQAPMRRYKTGIALDWVRNRARVWRENGLPPAHLLRHVFETARDYEEAKAMLSETPVALPVIYVLGNAKAPGACVIERLENAASVREMGDGAQVCAANHFASSFNGQGAGWMPRPSNSAGRAEAARRLDPRILTHDFAWFTPPIANRFSRLGLLADSEGGISLVGTEGERYVTQIFRMELQ